MSNTQQPIMIEEFLKIEPSRINNRKCAFKPDQIQFDAFGLLIITVSDDNCILVYDVDDIESNRGRNEIPRTIISPDEIKASSNYLGFKDYDQNQTENNDAILFAKIGLHYIHDITRIANILISKISSPQNAFFAFEQRYLDYVDFYPGINSNIVNNHNSYNDSNASSKHENGQVSNHFHPLQRFMISSAFMNFPENSAVYTDYNFMILQFNGDESIIASADNRGRVLILENNAAHHENASLKPIQYIQPFGQPRSMNFFDSHDFLTISSECGVFRGFLNEWSTDPNLNKQLLFMGHAELWGFQDGYKTFARFQWINSILMTADQSTLFIADSGNSCIRVFQFATEMVSTIRNDNPQYPELNWPYCLSWHGNDILIACRLANSIAIMRGAYDNLSYQQLQSAPEKLISNQRMWI